MSNKEPIKPQESTGRSWWSWRKKNTSRETTPAPEPLTPVTEVQNVVEVIGKTEKKKPKIL